MIVAELLRFYGGAPMTWLAETPVAVLNACLAEIPRLRATEALEQASVVAVGSGSLKKDASQATLRAWRHLAGLDRRPASTSTRQARPNLAGLGLGLRKVPRRKPVPHG